MGIHSNPFQFFLIKLNAHKRLILLPKAQNSLDNQKHSLIRIAGLRMVASKLHRVMQLNGFSTYFALCSVLEHPSGAGLQGDLRDTHLTSCNAALTHCWGGTVRTTPI